jgi:hypothetical protein
MTVDYTFGFDKKSIDTYGAKEVMLDAIRGYIGKSEKIMTHPSVKVPADRKRQDAKKEALSMHKGKYFVVRASSRHELLPGTSGMTDSLRFVEREHLEDAIEYAREPGYYYDLFVETNGLQREDVLPVIIQPMVAERRKVIQKAYFRWQGRYSRSFRRSRKALPKATHGSRNTGRALEQRSMQYTS